LDDPHKYLAIVRWKVQSDNPISRLQSLRETFMTTNAPILVIGATGKVGRRVVTGLQAKGRKVRIGSRHAALPFDWQDRSNWTAHFAGIDTAYVAYYPDLAAPQGVDDIAALASVAGAAGVRRMVLLSGRGESGAERAEQALRESGLAYTILRAAWFNQNFSEGHLQPSVMGGMVAIPAGQRVEPFIDVDDIAEVAIAALTDDRHNNQLYVLTGPRLLTFGDAVAAINVASGLSVAYLPVSLEDFHAGISAEFGADVADLLTSVCAETFDGRNESLGDGVQRALGRPPRDFADFCHQAAQSGAWRQAA
jgi:uncharacterized protein YbjT (DUF2867 family)